MARVSEEELDRLKREVSVARLAEAMGVKLARTGKDLLGLCPFHDDRNPSLVISPARNLWHCLGACNAGGSVIDWVMRAQNVSFRHAVELLRRDACLTEAAPEPGGKGGGAAPALPPLAATDARDEELAREVIAWYHATLLENEEALAYLESRGLRDPGLIKRFQLGFANRTLGYRLPHARRLDGAGLRGRLQKLGFLRESGHEHFNGSLVIPVLDGQGRVLEVYGRKIGKGLREGTPLHLYLPGPHAGVWNEQALSARDVILCEALIDALTFHRHGFTNVTAAYGVNGFTPDHHQAFARHGVRRVFLAYDRDEAGDRAAEALARELASKGIECLRVEFPRGMDANLYACKVQPADKALALLLRNARWMGTGPARDVSREVQAPPMREPSPPEAPAGEPAQAAPGAPEASGAQPETQAPSPPSLLAAAVAPAAAAVIPSAAEAAPAPDQTAELATLPALPASRPLPAEIEVERREGELFLQLGERRYRVRGLDKNTSHEVLKINLLVSTAEGCHVDSFDMYCARHRQAFARQAAEELRLREELLRKDLGTLLLHLEEMQQDTLKHTPDPVAAPVMSDAERKRAMALLEDPDLVPRILEDFARAGTIGEETNKLTGYLAAVSRKLDEPLAVIVQSASAAGKSSLMESVLRFVPEEEKVQYSAMTGQALYYLGETNLKHKVLAIAEAEGAERAGYALKLLQSEGSLTIASTGKDPATGRLITEEYRVQGPVMIFLTTTAAEIDEELLNRCLVLTVDEDRAQTRAIHKLQRESQTLEGLLARHDRQGVLRLHQNAQRLLQPLPVVNPFARGLTFLDSRTRTRRDHMKYLTLIRVIALLHQYQRPRKQVRRGEETITYIEASARDVALANRLAHEVLGRSLDELPPQARRLLQILDQEITRACKTRCLARADCLFTRRDVRGWSGWSDFQVRVHLQKLADMEYVLAHRGGRGLSFVYELAYDGGGLDGSPFLAGLIDADELVRAAGEAVGETAARPGDHAATTTPTPRGETAGSRGPGADIEGPTRPQSAPKEGPFKSAASSLAAEAAKGKTPVLQNRADNADREEGAASARRTGAVVVLEAGAGEGAH